MDTARSSLSDWAAGLTQQGLDLLVVGGGATGLGVAVQAALEGRRVALVEAGDFACGTSSRSTKLLHGGVRYLAQGQLGLVREALRERAIAMRRAPHLAQPLPFVLAEPHPARRWIAWLGLKAYEWLAGDRSLGVTRLACWQAAGGNGCRGVRYWDGQFEDARYALALARSAQAQGALLRNHTRVVGLAATQDGWSVLLQDSLGTQQAQLQVPCVVNATGVWVDGLRRLAAGPGQAAPAALVQPSQGVHVVVERATLPLEEAVLVPRTSDGRVLFALPWLGATVIGTTDTPRTDTPAEPRATAAELEFLCAEARRSFGVALNADTVKSVWVGLRPLVGAPAAGHTRSLSREHLIVREASGFHTVTGGKWTTYRSMACEVLESMVVSGDLPPAPRQASTLAHELSGSPTQASGCVSLRDPPGPHLLGSEQARLAEYPGHGVLLDLGLSEAMVRHSARTEWALTVEDMLARRWRALFLDARRARAMAPRVAQILAEETGEDPQLPAFLKLCDSYLFPSDTDGQTPKET